jgi:recombination protein RecT
MSEITSNVLGRPKLPENFLDPVGEEIAKVIPQNTVTAAALTRIVITAVNKSPKLRECTQASILACTLDIAAVGLMPNTPQGFAWLIPYKNNDKGGVYECTLQIGYRGFVELSYRSGQVKIIQADVVREGDEFEHEKGTETRLRHIKDVTPGRSQRALIAAWAIIELIGGGRNLEIMDAEELARIQKQAEKFKSSPAWQHWPDEQRKKTVLKRMLKILQIGSTPMIQKALEIEAKTAIPVEQEALPITPQVTFDDPPPSETTIAEPNVSEDVKRNREKRSQEPTPPGLSRHPETQELVDQQGNFVW